MNAHVTTVLCITFQIANDISMASLYLCRDLLNLIIVFKSIEEYSLFIHKVVELYYLMAKMFFSVIVVIVQLVRAIKYFIGFVI